MINKNRDLRAALYGLVIDPLPDVVRNSLLLDPSFCDKLGIAPKFRISLGPKLAVETGSLYGALRAAVGGKKTAMLSLRGSGRNRVKLKRQTGGRVGLFLGKEGFSFSDADLLAEDRRTRTRAVARVFSAKPLSAEEEEAWRTIAKERALTDREYLDLMTALDATPEAVCNELLKPQNLDADKLVPDDPAYYRQLIAPIHHSADLNAFIGDELASTRKALLQRHRTRALRRMAFSALWQPLIPFDLLASVSVPEVTPLLQAEDPFSLLFGFELCRDRLQADAGFDELGLRFIEKLLLDADASMNRCNIFSAVALIASTRVRSAARASNAPLFWVRLSALAHAGVLTDALRGMAQSERFLRWSVENFSPTYVWHGVIDRREAPRWKPDWISPDHIYAELVGRVQGAVHMVPEEQRPARWIAAIEAAVAKLMETGRALAAYFPGPFDDFREPPIGPLGNEAAEMVKAKLHAASLLSDVPELFALFYATTPSDDVVEKVLGILTQPADHPVALREQEVSYLQLCAHIAAAARSESIANAVIDRCLYEVRRPGSEAAVTDLFAIMVECCAAIAVSKEYYERIGAAAANLCFAVEKESDLINLESVFHVLATRNEKLIPALARARAVARTKRSG